MGAGWWLQARRSNRQRVARDWGTGAGLRFPSDEEDDDFGAPLGNCLSTFFCS